MFNPIQNKLGYIDKCRLDAHFSVNEYLNNCMENKIYLRNDSHPFNESLIQLIAVSLINQYISK